MAPTSTKAELDLEGLVFGRPKDTGRSENDPYESSKKRRSSRTLNTRSSDGNNVSGGRDLAFFVDKRKHSASATRFNSSIREQDSRRRRSSASLGGESSQSESNGRDVEDVEDKEAEETSWESRKASALNVSAEVSTKSDAFVPESDTRVEQAVWVDEEEEQLRVEVAVVKRLRKLRRSQDERVLTGAEYRERLRQQHLRLHPGTEWAQPLRAQAGEMGGRRGRAEARSEREVGEVDVAEEADEEVDGMDGTSGLEVSGGSEGDEDGVGALPAALLQGAGSLVQRGGRPVSLPAGRLAVARLADANQQDAGRQRAAVRTVDWHPNGQLLLAGAWDKRLRFFHIDGRDNPLLQTLFFEGAPVSRAAFVAGGAQVVVGGAQRCFHVVDVASGHVSRVNGLVGREEAAFDRFVVSPDGGLLAFLSADGAVLLVAARSRQWVASLKLSGSVEAAAFVPQPGGSALQLAALGSDGDVYHWDLRQMRCVHRRRDHGSVGGTALAVSADGRLLATGSRSGVVNLYDREGFLGEGGEGAGEEGWGAPREGQPLHSFANLTTAVDQLAFNHDGRMLGMASSEAQHAMRVAHVPSRSVFGNWPTPRSGLQRVQSWQWSPRSGMLAVGNAAGRVPLYRLKHYPSA